MKIKLDPDEEQLLDLFAALAMQSAMTAVADDLRVGGDHFQRISVMAYHQAEAMLVERRKRLEASCK
jgi:hypothetical protein